MFPVFRNISGIGRWLTQLHFFNRSAWVFTSSRAVWQKIQSPFPDLCKAALV
jgi:hypothetical protein